MRAKLYKRITQPVEAVQYKEAEALDIAQWMFPAAEAVKLPDLLKDFKEKIKIKEGDYIVKQKEGMFNFLKAEVFHENFKSLED